MCLLILKQIKKDISARVDITNCHCEAKYMHKEVKINLTKQSSKIRCCYQEDCFVGKITIFTGAKCLAMTNKN